MSRCLCGEQNRNVITHRTVEVPPTPDIYSLKERVLVSQAPGPFFGPTSKAYSFFEKKRQKLSFEQGLPRQKVDRLSGRNFVFWLCFFVIDANVDLDGDFLLDGENLDFSAWS